MRLKRKSAACGNSDTELSLPTGRCGNQWPLAGLCSPAKPKVWCCNCCSASLCFGRTGLGRKVGIWAGLPRPVSIPWKPQALEGLIVTSGRWDGMTVTIAHLGCRFWELFHSAIPNNISGLFEAKPSTFGPLVPSAASLTCLWSPVWKWREHGITE